MSDSFRQLSITLAQVILPIIIVVCIVGNILNALVLTRPILRNNACSYYFLALSVNNLIYSIVLIYYLLVNGYQLDIKLTSSWWCKITQYIATGCPFASPYFIVLASIDRFCASSRSVKLRSFSNITIARWSIFSTILFTVLFFINTLVLNDLRNYVKVFCIIRTDIVHSAAYVFTQIILYAAIPPCLMAFFGLLTIYNISRTTIAPVANTSHRRTEGQLIGMLLVQVVTYLILNMPLCILYLILVLGPGIPTTMIFSYAFMIAPFLFHSSYAITFFLYIFSAKIYRKELIRLLAKILPIRKANRIGPITKKTTITVATVRTAA